MPDVREINQFPKYDDAFFQLYHSAEKYEGKKPLEKCHWYLEMNEKLLQRVL